MAQLAVLILTLNEADNIRDCIHSASFADEIIVVDSGSSDRTGEIAVQLGARVVVHPMDKGFGEQRNFALRQTEKEWVLFLDADERIPEKLGKEIRRMIERQEPAAYEILRRNVVFGQMIVHGGHAPDWSLRLYPRTAIHWEGVVHESAKVSLPVKRCQESMLHYTYTSWDKYFTKFNHYTTLMAEKNLAAGKRAKLSDLIFRPLVGFIKMYFLKRGFLDGRMGFILAALHAGYTFTKYIKLEQLQKHSNERNREAL